MLYDNIGLIVSRQGQASDLSNWNVVFCTDRIVDLNVFRRGGGCLFPLYVYTNEFGQMKRKPNLKAELVKKFADQLSLKYVESLDKASRGTCFSADDFWNYIYAVLHSPAYRTKYKEFLNLDFPRIPCLSDQEVFWKLVDYGRAIRKVHLMEDEECKSLYKGDFIEGTNLIEKISFKNNCVYINKSQYFTDVDEKLWKFQIGGYQPLEKWLKDRKGMMLSTHDVMHYRMIAGALIKTMTLMKEIDGIIQDILT